MSSQANWEFVQPSLTHLKTLTDDTGIIQHGRYGLPDLATGYTTDDNARAIIVALAHHLNGDLETLPLANRYLAFLLWAQLDDGRFHNFVSYDRRFLDEVGSEDSFGRSVWALGFASQAALPGSLRLAAVEAFQRALPRINDLRFLRALGYSAAGVAILAEHDRQPAMLEVLGRIAEDLYAAHRVTAGREWDWFEPFLTYGNATLPKALFLAHSLSGRAKYLRVAERSLSFLIDQTFAQGYFSPPGNRGWWMGPGNPRPQYDQQPLEAGEMIEACSLAYRLTGRGLYREAAEKALAWFYGENSQGLALYDPETGGSYDGLTPEGLNLNQGAESILSLQLGSLAWRLLAEPASSRSA